MAFLSQHARKKLLDEAQQHLSQHLTKDPAMPVVLRNCITNWISIFWQDFVQEFDETIERKAMEGTGVEVQEAELADLAAGSEVAMGMLQVLVVEARNLRPAQGMTTNPYARGMLGHQVRCSKTNWSTLSPAWSALMEFPVVSMNATLDLEVMSKAPLFGGDTRLGHISLPLKDIIGAAPAQSADSRYRIEKLQGTRQGEVVLIVDYKPMERRRGGGCIKGCLDRSRRKLAQFRAFFLYHYWPCDKSLFQMYLKEPIDICVLLLALSPSVMVRSVFFTVVLLCLSIPWAPDEHQIVQFILACKGTAIFTDGFARALSGFFIYYSCIRDGSCHSGGGPGSGTGIIAVAFDLYIEVLIWFACFVLLPRTSRLGPRAGATAASSSSTGQAANAEVGDGEADIRKGGRMNVLLKYNLVCFAWCLVLFGALSAKDLMGADMQHVKDEVWMWRIPENFYWCRSLFGFSMFPFCILLHPRLNKLFTHSTQTGFTRLGTLQRYEARHRNQKTKSPKSKPKGAEKRQDQPDIASPPQSTTSGMPIIGVVAGDACNAPAKIPEVGRSGNNLDPVGDLKKIIVRFPCGSLALGAVELAFRPCTLALSTTKRIVSFEIRTASYFVSSALRVADASVTTTVFIAHYIPGVSFSMRMGGRGVSCAQQLGNVTLSKSTTLVRRLPGGSTVLGTLEDILQTVGFLAAEIESPGFEGQATPPLLAASSQQAEALKHEAAARLAKILTHAENAAEWTAETAEWIAVRPEVSTIAQALAAQPHRFRTVSRRVFAAGDAFSQSLWACVKTLTFRLVAANKTLVRAFRRELVEFKLQAPGRGPGWKPTCRAYQRLVCSTVCEAFFELSPTFPIAVRLADAPLDEPQSTLSSPESHSIPLDATSRAQLPEEWSLSTPAPSGKVEQPRLRRGVTAPASNFHPASQLHDALTGLQTNPLPEDAK